MGRAWRGGDRSATRLAVAITVLAMCVATVTACTQSQPDTPPPTPTPTPTPVLQGETRLPDGPAAVLPGADDAALALTASSTLFASSPVAVLAPSLDPKAQLRAASVAIALGAPLLLEPAPGPAPEPAPDAGPADAPAADVIGELERLDVVAVVTVGDVGGADLDQQLAGDVVVVPAPADDAALAELLGVDLAAQPVLPSTTGTGEVAAVTALDRDAPALLATDASATGQPSTASAEPAEPAVPTEPAVPDAPTVEPTTTPPQTASAETALPGTDLFRTEQPDTQPSDTEPSDTEPSNTRLPETRLPEAPAGALVLTTGHPSQVAAVATARAADIDVVEVIGADPRVQPSVVRAVAAAAPTTVVGLGEAFGTADDLAWKAATAATGVELPGGGQVLFSGPATGRRMVAMYGSPGIPALGILGEQDVAASIARAQGLAAEYQPLTSDVVVPAFEIIATIADRPAGADGNYSNELPVETFVPWIEAALQAGVYVVLDLQPGRTDFLAQARMYEPLLTYPNVGLALDPEWRLAPDQEHLRQIGSVGVEEINAVADYLADLTRTNRLPQKLLIVHQFQQRMVVGREWLDTADPAIQVLIHVDGQGSQAAKAGTWAAILAGAPANVVWGWKNFIHEDVPMAAPPQTYQVAPAPHFVSYQ